MTLQHLRCIPYSSISAARCSAAAMAEPADLCTRRIQDLARLGKVADAREVFDAMPSRDAFAWNSMISGYFQNCMPDEARRLFDSFAGKNVRTWTLAVSGYAKARRVEEARRLFDAMPERNTVSWNAMISGYIGNGDIPAARRVFDRMPQRNVATWNAMITAYCHSHQMDEARRLFDRMNDRNVVSWTVMLSGYVQIEDFREAWRIFQKMHRAGDLPDIANFMAAISAVAGLSDVKLLESLRPLAIKTDFEEDVVVGTAILNAYARDGVVGMDSALKFFDGMPERNEYSWSSIIASLSQAGRLEDALHVYETDPQKSTATRTAMMTCLIRNGRIHEARCLFDEMPDPVVVSWNAVIAGYAQKGMLDEAEEMFDRMPGRNAASWAAMIAGYAQNGRSGDALRFLSRAHNLGMCPNASGFTSGFFACANLGDLKMGRQLHSLTIKAGPQSNAYVNNGLITMYSKCKNPKEVRRFFGGMRNRDVVSWNSLIAGLSQNSMLDDAVAAFESMPKRDVVSWTAIISSYAQAEDGGDRALRMFIRMFCEEGLLPNTSTFATVFSVCGCLGALRLGKQIHSVAVKLGHDLDLFVGNALITMSFKCGAIDSAFKVFAEMPERDVITWNSVFVGFGQHGYGIEAVELFKLMKSEGVAPDQDTFLGLLSACSHAGLVDEGRKFFDSMSREHRLTPTVGHYACMVDLLGRAGRLREAKDLVEGMPIEPDPVVWAALLSACRIHEDVQLGRRVFERLMDTEPRSSGHYVLLSNIYAAQGMWDEVDQTRRKMEARSVYKTRGGSTRFAPSWRDCVGG